jgi:hypothetical protein
MTEKRCQELYDQYCHLTGKKFLHKQSGNIVLLLRMEIQPQPILKHEFEIFCIFRDENTKRPSVELLQSVLRTHLYDLL